MLIFMRNFRINYFVFYIYNKNTIFNARSNKLYYGYFLYHTFSCPGIKIKVGMIVKYSVLGIGSVKSFFIFY